MEQHGYLIRLSDGSNDRHTVLLASSPEHAHHKAASFFKDTKWRILAVNEIAK